MQRCDHCLLPIPLGAAVESELGGASHRFCCTGCASVYRFIHDQGLDTFYARRRPADAGQPVTHARDGLALDAFTTTVRAEDGRCEVELAIDGIHCASCVWLNEKVLGRVDGVERARVNYATHIARVRWDPAKTDLSALLTRIRAVGYTPRPYDPSTQAASRRAVQQDLLIRFGTAAFLSMQLMLYSAALYAGYFQGMEPGLQRIFQVIAAALAAPIILYSGAPFVGGALRGLRTGRFNMDSLIAIGAISAYSYSVYQMTTGGEVYFDTAAMIITLVLLGRYIEAVAKGKASQAIARLAELLPRAAAVLETPQQTAPPTMVALGDIAPGDLVRVVPGQRIPLDGVVVDGASEVDESMLTGESRPVAKVLGSLVVGGSLNLDGAFVARVTASERESTVARIIRAVEHAQEHKPRVQKLADRIVGVFVPIIIILALATIAWHLAAGATASQAWMVGVSVLVIACPCSLGLATPLAVLVFTSSAARLGVLVRSGTIVEALVGVTDVVFDKTGTLTHGEPTLRALHLVADVDGGEARVLGLVAALEASSEHPLGRALVRAGRQHLGATEVEGVTGFEAVPGRGVRGRLRVAGGVHEVVVGNLRWLMDCAVATVDGSSCEGVVDAAHARGNTVVYVALDGLAVALVVLEDQLRDAAAATVAALRESYRVTILSGDAAPTTQALADEVGADEAIAEVDPGEKAGHIARWQLQNRRVLMAGDGINDAPALSAASVGIAMGRGTDIAMESADAVLSRCDIGAIPAFMRLGAVCMRVIRQNIFWAFAYNVAAIPAAMAGVLHPIVAAGAMATSSLLVVLNSLRVARSE